MTSGTVDPKAKEKEELCVVLYWTDSRKTLNLNGNFFLLLLYNKLLAHVLASPKLLIVEEAYACSDSYQVRLARGTRDTR